MTDGEKSKTLDGQGSGHARVIGENLRYLRVAAGLSQQDIGGVLGVSYQQVQKYEQGHNRFPIEGLHRLKHYYNVPYEVFFRGVKPDTGMDLYMPHERDISLYIRLGHLKNRSLKKRIESVVSTLLEFDSE